MSSQGEHPGDVGVHSADPTARERALALIGQVIAGRYRVDAILAMGGMGAVFRGEHVHMRKRVAIKVLHPETQNLPELVTRFERESVVGAHATHPNVVSATDFGRLEDGSYYLILECVEGITLHDLMRKGQMPVRRAVEITRQLALALDAVHKLDIFHRDLKPRNVMVVEGDPDVVKLIDFGFAKVPLERFSPTVAQAITVTASGMVFGTVGYMAPETAYGMHAVTHRSDLYAVGVLLYEMLTGKHPFDEKESKALFHKHQMEKPPTFRVRAPDRKVPPALEAITLRLLEKAPRDRYESAQSLIDALDDAMGGAPVSSKPMTSRRGSSVPASGPGGIDDSPPPAEAAPPRERRRSSAVPWVLTAALVVVAGTLLAFPDWREKLAQALGPMGAPLAPAAKTTAPAAPSKPVASATDNATSAAPTSTGAPTAAMSASAGAANAPPRPTTIDGLDGAKWRGVIREAATAVDPSRGVKAFLALTKIDPSAFQEPDVTAAAAAAAVGAESGDRTTADEVFGLLSSDELGPGGPDVLLQITSVYGGSKGAKRAAELLARPEVLARASPGMKVAMALRDAPCRERPTLFDRAAAEGDERALLILSKMRAPECQPSSGACCLPGDPRVAAAVGQMKARLKK